MRCQRFYHPADPGGGSNAYLDDQADEKQRENEFREAASVEIRVDGKVIGHEIVSLDLTQAVDQHHELRVRLFDVEGSVELEGFRNPKDFAAYLGKTISVSASLVSQRDSSDGSAGLAFTGVVTNVQLKSRVDGMAVAIITASSPTVVMDGAGRNRFLSDSDLSGALSMLLKPYPITVGGVSVSGEKLRGEIQYRETDFAFLMRLATGYGYFAFYDGESFFVRKANSTGAVTLSWRETLGSFTLGIGTGQQEFATASYKQLTLDEIKSDSSSRSLNVSLSGFSKTSVDASKRLYKASGFQEINPSTDASTVDKTLDVVRNRSLGRMMKCVGMSVVPTVKVGSCVQVQGMGDLNGHYFVTRIVHNLNEGGYVNKFECIPLDMAHPQAYSRVFKGAHVQSAVVVDNKDPEKLGRIKVSYPWSSPETTEWTRAISPDAGKERGFYAVPEIGDEVLVAFERGDPSQPVIIGSYYNSKLKPHADGPNDDNLVRQWVTKTGNQIYLSDEDGKQEIRIITGGGKNSIVMKADGPSITITSDGGDITFKGKNITLNTDDKVEIKSGADMKIEAGANLQIKASASGKIESGADLTVKGAMIKLN